MNSRRKTTQLDARDRMPIFLKSPLDVSDHVSSSSSSGWSLVRRATSVSPLRKVKVVAEVFPNTDCRRCVVHFYRNVFSHVPNGKVAEGARMLKSVHAQESRRTTQTKASETMTYYAYPSTHWRQLRTNNPLKRITREIRRRIRVVMAFPDGHSALM